MGEKIKDINKIHLCNSELMVELNEGYSAKQGRVIHIQNPSFRLLLKIDDFCKMASDILRAETELNYIKSDTVKGVSKSEKNDVYTVKETSDLYLIDILNSVDYRLIKRNKHLATLLVNPINKNEYKRIIKDLKLKSYIHPYSKYFGHNFLYQMDEFEIIEHKGVLYEVMYQLPCMSLTNNTWVPLDRMIQNSIWEKRRIQKNGVYLIDDNSLWIYRICDCIFRKRVFDVFDIHYFSERKSMLSDEELNEFMNKVFFKSKEIIKYDIEKNKFDSLVQDYLKFQLY